METVSIQNCPNCVGTHFGSNKCPYIEKPCVICGDSTVLACSDCAINSSGNVSVHVCSKSSCRDAHEANAHCAPDSSMTAPAAPPRLSDEEIRDWVASWRTLGYDGAIVVVEQLLAERDAARERKSEMEGKDG